MSKITFRADDALVEQLDALDASKSEVMREALREFLDRHPEVGGEREVTARTNDEASTPTGAELTVNINLDGATDDADATVDGATATVETEDDDGKACKQCGEAISPEHSFCPNCGEEHRRPPRCECGEEISSDWAFCPGCGRRSPTSDVFDRA